MGERLAGFEEADLGELEVKVSDAGSLLRSATGPDGTPSRVLHKRVTYLDPLPADRPAAMCQANRIKLRVNQNVGVITQKNTGSFKFIDPIEVKNKEGAALFDALNDTKRFPPNSDDPKVLEARAKMETALEKAIQDVRTLRSAGPPARLERKAKSVLYPDEMMGRLERTLMEEAPAGSPTLFQLKESAKPLVKKLRNGTSDPRNKYKQAEIANREFDIEEAQGKRKTRMDELIKESNEEFGNIDKAMEYVMEDMVLSGGKTSGGRLPALANVMSEQLGNPKHRHILEMLIRAHEEIKTNDIGTSYASRSKKPLL